MPQRVAVLVAAFLVLTSCFRRDGGATSDSSAANADSITAATVAKPGTSPSGEPASPSNSPTTPTTRTTKSRPPAPRSDVGAGPPATQPTRPHLSRLTPASGSLATGEIITVEITGDRLTTTGNTVFFGPMKLGAVGSSDGRLLSFVVPPTVPSRSEVPPMAVQPGRYGVYVVNANGTSDTLFFTIRGSEY